MATEWKSQQGEGKFALQFETDDIQKYKLVEKAAQMTMDGKTEADVVELSEVKKVIMDYILDHTVSKFPTAELCRASRMGAEGVIYALENAFGAKMDGVRKEDV